MMKWIPSPDGVCRFCFIAKKKNGNAVYRNRCRRVLRHLFLSAIPQIKNPVWAIVLVNDKAAEVTALRLRESSDFIFEKMNWGSP
jgi:ribonuclease P protein component